MKAINIIIETTNYKRSAVNNVVSLLYATPENNIIIIIIIIIFIQLQYQIRKKVLNLIKKYIFRTLSCFMQLRRTVVKTSL